MLLIDVYECIDVAECGCNRNGTIGGLVSCDTKLGQCFCKTSVTSRQCDQCADGYYSLSDDNLFGCTGKHWVP